MALAQQRQSVLLISTDPAHNLSDAFGQRFNKTAALVSGFTNLYAMEIDPTVEVELSDGLTDSSSQSLLSDLLSSIPGIDEAMAFSELMRSVDSMDYSAIVFDTAPTGHTLRLLSFPALLDRALSRLLALQSGLSPLLSHLSAVTGVQASESSVQSKLQQLKATIDSVNAQFRNAALTTFVCVCIPEFLSLYETERLVQELAKAEIDVQNIGHHTAHRTASHCYYCHKAALSQRVSPSHGQEAHDRKPYSSVCAVCCVRPAVQW